MSYQQNNPQKNSQYRKNVDGSKPEDLSEEEILSKFVPDDIKEINNMVYKALEGISKQESYFRARKIVDKTVEKGNKFRKFAEHPYFEDVVSIVVSRLDLVAIGDSGYLTTHDIQHREKKMIALGGHVTTEHVLDEKIVQAAIEARAGISPEQIDAVKAATFSEAFVTIIEGTAGAGKSFTMAAVKKAYIDSGYHVMGTALSWNAATVLAASTGLSDCEALQGLIKKIQEATKSGIEYFRKPTLLIVDEAGLVGSKHMYQLLKACYEAKEKVKVVLTGDSLQLNPVDAGNSLEALVAFLGTTRIDTIRRQRQDSHKKAVKLFSARNSGPALYTFKHQEALHWCANKETQYNVIVRNFLSYKNAYPNKKPLILAFANKDVSELNRRVRAAYKKMGLVYGKEVGLSVTDGRESWKASFAVGDEIVMRASSKELLVYKIPSDPSNFDESTWEQARVGVFNRNNGKIVGVKKSNNPLGSYDLIIDMSGDLEGRVVLNTKKFRHQELPAFPVVHNFATTIYASQGQTVNKVFLVDDKGIEFRLAYVGMSRHTDSVDIYLNESALHTQIDVELGKAKPVQSKKNDRNSKFNKPVDELPVVLGRYTRSEMLSRVAKSWGAEKKNETAIMFAKRYRLDDPNKANEQKNITEIQYSGNDEPIVDFDMSRVTVESNETWESLAKRCEIDTENDLAFKKWLLDIKKFNKLEDNYVLEEGDILFLSERLNVSYPLIDLQKLMSLPDPVSETITISDFDVEQYNKNNDNLVDIPLKGEVKPENNKSKGSHYSMFEDDIPEMEENKKKNSDILSSLGFDFFTKQEPVKNANDPNLNAVSEPTIVDKVRDFMQENFDYQPEIDLPFIEEDKKIGFINRKGILEFEDGVQGVSKEFLAKTKGVFWGEGKDYEPRIFATRNDGEIFARYDLSGKCVTSEAYPPMLINPDRTSETPIMIVPDAKQWLWMHEYNQTKKTVEPHKKHNIIWAAKDVDWNYIAKPLQGKDITLARGKDNNRIEWAIELQDRLWSKFKLKTKIHPEVPGRVYPWDQQENNYNNSNKPKI